MDNIGKGVIGVLMFIIVTLVKAWTLVQLWTWFVVPVFGLGALELPYAIGLNLIVVAILAKRPKAIKEKEFWERYYLDVTFKITMSIFVLCLGWVVNLFI